MFPLGLATGGFLGWFAAGRRPVTCAARRLAGCSDPTLPNIRHARGVRFAVHLYNARDLKMSSKTLCANIV